MRVSGCATVLAALLLAACGGEEGAADEGAPAQSRVEAAAAVPAAAMAQEAESILRQAYGVQDAYRQEHGRYAATLDELAQAGWQNPQPRYYRLPRIVRARGEALCMEMQPGGGADLWPQHVDQTGEVRRGACP
jgi:hypothetical protein